MSLLELAIVLALLTIIAAIVVPSIAPRLARTREREGLARVESAVAIAQNRARRTGHALRLVVTPDEPQRLLTQPLAERDPDADPEPIDPGGEYLAELPARCRLAPASDEAQPALLVAPAAESPGETDEPVTLGWALPDGTFEPADPCTLETDRGTFTLTIDAWTGNVTAEPVPTEPEPTALAGVGP